MIDDDFGETDAFSLAFSLAFTIRSLSFGAVRAFGFDKSFIRLFCASCATVGSSDVDVDVDVALPFCA
jgi:hypothetical protein